ncbi:MAG TPA: pyruvate kinase [Acidimicrobiales bacterium]|nr:pyruvate kinase [Acidimicrobiales bacterium]
MARRTKIIATIGPSCSDAPTLRAMMEAGMDVARINLSHGSLDDSLALYRRIRSVSHEWGHHLGILGDLPGPKVRCASFPEGGAELVEGELISLRPGNSHSDSHDIEVDYETLAVDLHIGDRLAFGDGSVVAVVEDSDGDSLKARVVFGGKLQGRPGLHIPSDRLRLTAPTDNDLKLLDAFVTEGVDMVALSFVRSAHDLRRLGVEPAPRGPMVIAKVETRAAVDNLDGIIEASGAVMVARGDLGAECPIEELPHLQKVIIERCIALGRPAITATQMLESMIHAPVPTRAEASDVANAVFDGSSAVMLSGETAIGRDPVNTVRTMARITARADEEFDYETWAQRIMNLREDQTQREEDVITDAITMAAWRVSETLDAKAIICLSQTGFTVRSIARFRPTTPILGFSPDPRTINQLTLSWGATPIRTGDHATTAALVEDSLRLARDARGLRTGDPVVVISGHSTRTRATDTLRVMRIP